MSDGDTEYESGRPELRPTKLVALMHHRSSKNRGFRAQERHVAMRLCCECVDYFDARPLLDEFRSSTLDKEKLNEAAYGILRNVAETHLSLGCSVFMVSQIEPGEYRAHLDSLVALVDAYGVPLIIIEVKWNQKRGSSKFKVDLNGVPQLILLGDSELDVPHATHISDRIYNFVEYFDMVLQSSKKCGGDRILDSTKFRHFSHCHPLLLNTSNQDNVKKTGRCSVCTRPIAGGSHYSCLSCRFFLHKQCAELPQHRESPIHTHPLRLVIASWEKKGNRLFIYNHWSYKNPEFKIKCLVCDSEERRPFYGCMHCHDLFVHDKCIRSLRPVVSHQAHPHQLTMETKDTKSPFHDYRCYACGGKGDIISYHCRESHFNFHIKCVLSLPLYVHHKGHKDHPLHLSMPPKDESNEYYCEVCTERRHPDYWIYICMGCEFRYEAHPHCVLQGIPRYTYKEDGTTQDDDDDNSDDDKDNNRLPE